MNRRSGSGSGPFLMEMLTVVGFFMICASICVSVFAGADRLSRKADRLNHAVLGAQSLMEELKAGKTEEELHCVWDRDWTAYTQREAEESGAAFPYKAEITVTMRGFMKYIRIDIKELGEKDSYQPVIYSLEGSRYEPGQRQQ